MTARSRVAWLALWYLALSFGTVGLWAQFAPASFYSSFPLNRGWVAVDGPFNEHLLRDFGGTNLALLLLAVAALRSPRTGIARALGTATIIFQVPHLLYHLGHLELLPTDLDRAANVAVLLSVLLAALVTVVVVPRDGVARAG